MSGRPVPGFALSPRSRLPHRRTGMKTPIHEIPSGMVSSRCNDGGKAMEITRKDVLVAVIANAVLVLGIHATQAEKASPPLSSAQIIEILASPDRTAADRTNDLRRKPEQMLGFIGIRPGIVALDLSAAGGYTTELLARSIGPTGKVYGQSRPPDPNPAPPNPAVAEGNRNPN